MAIDMKKIENNALNHKNVYFLRKPEFDIFNSRNKHTRL